MGSRVSVVGDREPEVLPGGVRSIAAERDIMARARPRKAPAPTIWDDVAVERAYRSLSLEQCDEARRKGRLGEAILEELDRQRHGPAPKPPTEAELAVRARDRYQSSLDRWRERRYLEMGDQAADWLAKVKVIQGSRETFAASGSTALVAAADRQLVDMGWLPPDGVVLVAPDGTVVPRPPPVAA